MPKNGHDNSSREIFSSPHGSFSGLPDTLGVLDHSAVARGSHSFLASRPGAPSGSVGGSAQLSGAFGAGSRPATAGVGQDKGALDSAPQGSSEPAPGTNDERRSDSERNGTRSSNRTDGLRRSARMTLRVRPGVKTALQRIATEGKVSLSTASATGLEVYARAKIHDQEEALFEPRMQAMMRREIRASDDRRVPFEIRTAIAAEQTRLIAADLYARQLRREGVPLPKIQEKLKGMYRQARSNVLKKTPQLKTILKQWWQESPEGEAAKPHNGGGEEGRR